MGSAADKESRWCTDSCLYLIIFIQNYKIKAFTTGLLLLKKNRSHPPSWVQLRCHLAHEVRHQPPARAVPLSIY